MMPFSAAWCVCGHTPKQQQLRDTGRSPTGVAFPDSVAIGEYNDDIHHMISCPYPAYVNSSGEGGKCVLSTK